MVQYTTWTHCIHTTIHGWWVFYVTKDGYYIQVYVVVIFVVLLLFVHHVWEVVSRDNVIIPHNILSCQCILLFHLVYWLLLLVESIDCAWHKHMRGTTQVEGAYLPNIVLLCPWSYYHAGWLLNKRTISIIIDPICSSIERILWFNIPQCTPLCSISKAVNCL